MDFGIYIPEIGKYITPLDKLLDLIEFIRELKGFYDLSIVERRMILMERYLTKFHNFEYGDKPVWAMLGRTENEEYLTNTRTKLRIDQYIANEIKDTFGYTLEEFLNLETGFLEELLDRQRKVLAERRELAKRQAKDADRKSRDDVYDLSGNLHRFNAF